MEGILFLDDRQVELLTNITKWLSEHFFLPKNRFDEDYLENYMVMIIDNDKPMYDRLYQGKTPVTTELYRLVIEIIEKDTYTKREDRKIIEIAFNNWLSVITDRTFEEIFASTIDYANDKRKEYKEKL